MNDYIERGNYYEFGGRTWVLAEDFRFLFAEVMRLRAQIAHLEQANGTQEVSDE